MKCFFTVLTALLAIFTVNAQNFNDLAVEKQYPDDSKALEVYQAAVDRQVDPATPASKVTWLANKPANNWFFSLEGGLAWLGSEGFREIDLADNLKLTGGFALGRWLNPVLGIRLDVSAAKLSTIMGESSMLYIGQNHTNPQGKETPESYWKADGSQFWKDRFFNDGKKYKNGYLCDFTYAGASVDLMVNLKNLFTPYNPNTFFNPVIYGGIGYAHTFMDGERTAVNVMMERFGLQFNFRLAKQWDLYLAVEDMMVPELFDRQIGGNREQDQVLSAKLGLTYHFGFNNFIKAPFGAVQTVEAAPDQSQIKALNDKINDLKQRLNDCLSKPAPTPVPVTPEHPVGLEPVFFNLDKYDIRDNSEMAKIEKAAQYLKDNKEAILVLAGFADVKTGSHSHNWTLSKNRINTVADVLVKKYGINKNRLIFAPGGDKTQPFSVNDKNRVVLFLK
ncbi:membrane protein [Bacteroidia bacterium]|nr:membrane protein [Bacteroidia bacterium]